MKTVQNALDDRSPSYPGDVAPKDEAPDARAGAAPDALPIGDREHRGPSLLSRLAGPAPRRSLFGR